MTSSTTALPENHGPGAKKPASDFFFGLDLLRAAAVIAVVFFHLPRTKGDLLLRVIGHFGWMGVDLFFVLSGFLIGSQLFQSLRKSGSIDFREFYLKRFFKILPAYWAVLLLFGLIPLFGGMESLPSPWRYLLFFQNFDLNFKFDSSVTWSLCVEEHFYLVFPVLLFAFRRHLGGNGRPRFITACAILSALGMILRSWIWSHSRPDLIAVEEAQSYRYLHDIYFPTYNRLDGLTAGASLAFLRVYRPMIWQRMLGAPKKALAIGFTLLAIGVGLFVNRNLWSACTLGYPVLSLGFAAMVVAVMSPRLAVSRWKSKTVTWVARASYAMYLVHLMGFKLAEAWIDPLGLGVAARVILSWGLILALTAALFYAVEKPFMRLRKIVLNEGGLPPLSPLPEILAEQPASPVK